MKILVNSTDREAVFSNLEAAKSYYAPDLTEFPECAEYADDIKRAETLDELAQILNKYTDTFGNGSEFSVKE